MANKSNKNNILKKEYLTIRSHPEYRVQITTTENEDGTYRVQAILVNAESLKHVAGAHYKTITVFSENELAIKRDILFRRVISQLNARPRQKATKDTERQEEAETTNQYREAYEKLVRDNVQIPGWGEETRTKSLSWFSRHFLPMLEKSFLGDDITFIGGPMFLEWKQREREKITRHGNSKNGRSVDATVARNFCVGLRIYEVLRQFNPDLPPIAEEELQASKVNRVEVEQVKSIPEPIRQEFWRTLEARAVSEANMVFAAVIMATTGVRTSEAAAVLPSDIEHFDGLAILPIKYQERNGNRDSILKSKNSYRTVILGAWAQAMVKTCQQNMTIPANPNQAPIKATDLSAWILARLEESGCSKRFIEDVANAEILFPDKAYGLITHDICAYLLRRDFASRGRNICGLTSEELDKLLGHALTERMAKWNQQDFALLEELRAVSQKLERYVYSTDPEYTRNPGFNPIAVEAETDIKLVPYSKIRLENISNEPLYYDLDTVACLASDKVGIKTPSEPEIFEMRSVKEGHPDGCIVGTNKREEEDEGTNENHEE